MIVAAIAGRPSSASAQQPFAIEFGCTIPGNTYICTATATPSTQKRFVIETVSFSGQAATGQTMGANFTVRTSGTTVFLWLPVQSFGPGPSAGKGVYVATLPVRLNVDSGSTIRLEVSRNSSTNSGATSYSQRLDLFGFLQ
jgi:hypothetical protein